MRPHAHAGSTRASRTTKGSRRVPPDSSCASQQNMSSAKEHRPCLLLQPKLGPTQVESNACCPPSVLVQDDAEEDDEDDEMDFDWRAKGFG